MTTAIYYRVSTEDQTLDMQKCAVEAWLDGLGRDLLLGEIKEYSDLGISGSTGKRPGFRRMIEDAEKGKIRTVIVYKLDRLTRDAKTAISVILRFDALDIKFIAITQPMFSHGTPFRHAMIAIFAELAQMERETIVERVKAGLTAAKKRGVKLGAPSKVTPALAFEANGLRLQGKTYKEIAKALKVSVGLAHKILKG